MIPQYMRNHEDNLKNFSLHFDYFSNWVNDKAEISYHAGKAKTITVHAANTLAQLHNRQAAVLKTAKNNGLLFMEITACLSTPFVSGLGSFHPTETGFILDRNTGLPYIPASAIKGVLRMAHTLDLAEKYPEEIICTDNDFEFPDTHQSLLKYFGYTDSKTETKDVRGQLVLLDAFPEKIPVLKQDIMNPHFATYYNAKTATPPLETESPVPLKFMAVEKGTSFKFRLFLLPLADGLQPTGCLNDEDRIAVLDMFKRAAEQLGFGAKTAVGYGRFDSIEDTTEKLHEKWQQMQEEENKRLYPWKDAIIKLDDIANWGDFRQQFLDNTNLAAFKNNAEFVEAVFNKATELSKQKWDEQRDNILVEWFAETDKKWPPETSDNRADTQNSAAELERLKATGKWADYIKAPAQLELLGKSGLKYLGEQLKKWGCEAKDATQEKKDELKRYKSARNKK